MKTLKLILLALIFISNFAFAADTGEISGTISLGKGQVAPKGAIVFIAARPAAGGPPMAVNKITDPKFPLEFKLGQKNSMMGGNLAGDVELTVRASQVQDPMSRTPGDLFGTLKTKAGAQKVKVVLDHKI